MHENVRELHAMTVLMFFSFLFFFRGVPAEPQGMYTR
jgi:hypothetical protein